MNRELLALNRRLYLDPPPITGLPSQEATPTLHVLGLNKELAYFGYSMDHDLIQTMSRLSPVMFEIIRTDLHTLLGDITGANANHTVLFAKFPYETPDQYEYLFRRIIGHLQNQFGIQSNHCTRLECGHVIDPTLFDLTEFGVCPICQFQSEGLSSADVAKYPFEAITPLKIIGVASREWLGQYGSRLIARTGSLSADERKILEFAKAENVPLAMPARVYRENLPFCYSLMKSAQPILPLLSGATDVLRIATYIADPAADLSLADASPNVKFHLTRTQMKHMFEMLNHFGANRLAEDMMRHREKWLRVAHLLHPWSKENRTTYPRVGAAFNLLRHEPKSILTFSRIIHRALRKKQIDDKFLRVITTRPGEFVRRVDAMLRKSDEKTQTLIIECLRSLLPQVPAKLAFEVSSAFQHRGFQRPMRYFIPKGQVTKIYHKPDTRAVLPNVVIERVMQQFEGHFVDRFAEMPEMGRVYIDPALRNILLPFNTRGDSSGQTAVMTKGSRYAVTGDFIRMFVHWTGNVDVVLSVNLFDQDMKSKGFVGWSRLRSGETIVHSGDIQDAPNGASEYIDIDIARVRMDGVRYVAPSMISFRGEPFNTFPCFAGFMERDALRSGKRFEAESVRWKTDINSASRSAVPLIFDLSTRQVIFADLTTGGGRGAGAYNVGKFQHIAKSVIELGLMKPSVYDVLAAHVLARGQLASSPAEADLTFMVDTVDVHDIVRDFITAADERKVS